MSNKSTLSQYVVGAFYCAKPAEFAKKAPSIIPLLWKKLFNAYPVHCSQVFEENKKDKVKSVKDESAFPFPLDADCEHFFLRRANSKAIAPHKDLHSITVNLVSGIVVIATLTDQALCEGYVQSFRKALEDILEEVVISYSYAYVCDSFWAPTYSEMGILYATEMRHLTGVEKSWRADCITRWQIFSTAPELKNFKDRMIRELLDYQILTDAHVNLSIEKMSLKDWIDSGNGRYGTLIKLAGNHWKWILNDRCSVDKMNRILYKNSLLVGWWPMGKDEPERRVEALSWFQDVPPKTRKKFEES